jgi:hypothetical protein
MMSYLKAAGMKEPFEIGMGKVCVLNRFAPICVLREDHG